MGPNGVASGSQGRWSWTGPSRSTLPASRSRNRAVEVIALPTEATGISAAGSRGRPDATSATPTASSRCHPPGPTSPTARPGRDSRVRANAPIRPAAAASDPCVLTRFLLNSPLPGDSLTGPLRC
jgi:hypothetical protein